MTRRLRFAMIVVFLGGGGSAALAAGGGGSAGGADAQRGILKCQTASAPQTSVVKKEVDPRHGTAAAPDAARSATPPGR